MKGEPTMDSKIFALKAFKTATFEEEGGTFTAFNSQFPGLFAGGYSLEECISDFLNAAETWYEVMRAKECPIPANQSFITHERKFA